MSIGIKLFIAIIVIIFIISLLSRAVSFPLRMVKKLFLSLIVGSIYIFVLNFFGSYINVSIPLNPITSILVGLLGIPGLLLIIAVKYL